MSLYDFLVILHVFSAILGLGPGFVMIYIVTTAKDMKELKHAYQIRNRVHHFVMIGGTLLLITGLGMALIRPYLFTEMWYVVSLVLYLIVLVGAPIFLSPRSKPIKQMLEEVGDEEIPENYDALAKELFLYERITNVIFLVIIFLMVTKPF